MSLWSQRKSPWGRKEQKGFGALSHEIYDPIVRIQPVPEVQISPGPLFSDWLKPNNGYSDKPIGEGKNGKGFVRSLTKSKIALLEFGQRRNFKSHWARTSLGRVGGLIGLHTRIC